MGIKKYALYFFGFCACFGLFGIIYAMNGGGEDGLLPLSIGLFLFCLICLVFIFYKEIIAFWNKHKIKTVRIVILSSIILLSILFGPRIYTECALTQQIRQICSAHSVEPTKIELIHDTYGDDYTAKIYCDDFTKFTHEEYVTFFDEMGECQSGKTSMYYLEAVVSGGKEYTVITEYINDRSTPVVYIDGKPMLKKYTSTECSSCHGTGRAKCGSCNGKGKKLVEWYSEGDWGLTSYTNYDCPTCDGRGRVDCYNCDGSGKVFSGA